MPYTSYSQCTECGNKQGLATLWNDEQCRKCNGDMKRVREYVSLID